MLLEVAGAVELAVSGWRLGVWFVATQKLLAGKPRALRCGCHSHSDALIRASMTSGRFQMLNTACIRSGSEQGGQPHANRPLHPGNMTPADDSQGQLHWGRPADISYRRTPIPIPPPGNIRPAMASVGMSRSLQELGFERQTFLVHTMTRPPRSLEVSSSGVGAVRGECPHHPRARKVVRTALLHLQLLQANREACVIQQTAQDAWLHKKHHQDVQLHNDEQQNDSLHKKR